MPEQRILMIAFARHRLDDGQLLYVENPLPDMETSGCLCDAIPADDDYWPLPADDAAYPLLAFDGTWQPESELPEDERNPEWSWRMEGTWRKATVADLVRAGLVAPAVVGGGGA